MSRWFASGGSPFYGLVVCPRCQQRADALFHAPLADGPAWVMPGSWTRAQRITCPQCGYARAAESGSLPFELWLKQPCRGRIVWAYSVAHIRGIERFLALGGTFDEEPGHPASMSTLEGLPKWMYQHRKEVKHCLRKLAELSLATKRNGI